MKNAALYFEGGQIDLARVVLGSLGERAIQAGFDFIDAGLVTEYTESLKGQYLPKEQWKALISEAHEKGGLNIDPFQAPIPRVMR